jgi:hypothetical protein
MVLWQGLFTCLHTNPAELLLPPPNRNWFRLKPCMLPQARRAATRLRFPPAVCLSPNFYYLLLLILLRRRLLIWLLRSPLLLLHLLLEQLLSLQFL